MAEGVKLVEAAEKSNAKYMLLENYPFMLFNNEMRKVLQEGTLGKFLYAEGEYNHPVAPDDLNFYKTYRFYVDHWRHYCPATYYITHSLAPIMQATRAIPIRVTAMPVFAPFTDEPLNLLRSADRAAIITCLNNDDSVFRITGCAQFGAHENSSRVCGINGQVESLRGMGEHVMLQYNAWSVPEGKKQINLYEPAWDDPDAEIIFGTTINEDLHDEVIVTVIATGLDDSDVIRAAAPAKEAAPAPVEEAPAAVVEEAPKHRAVFAADDEDKFELDIPSFLRGRGTL
jgi:hypothetical protein